MNDRRKVTIPSSLVNSNLFSEISKMPETILSLADIMQVVKPLAEKYKISEVYIFGSYARNEATAESDIVFLVVGGNRFKPTSVFAFSEELHIAFNKNIDVFEINEINAGSELYEKIMKEWIRVS